MGIGHCLSEQVTFAYAGCHVAEFIRIYYDAYQNPTQCSKYLGASSNDTNQRTDLPIFVWQPADLSFISSSAFILKDSTASSIHYIYSFYYFASFHAVTGHKFLFLSCWFLLFICSVLIPRIWTWIRTPLMLVLYRPHRKKGALWNTKEACFTALLGIWIHAVLG